MRQKRKNRLGGAVMRCREWWLAAFGFAANTHGRFAVSIETSINHIEALEEGDVLVAESVIEKVNNKLGFNIVEVKRGDELVALFKGVVYRTQKEWT